MNKYIYADHKSGGSLSIFAMDIMSADAEYADIMGIHPSKQNHVGCSFSPEVTCG